jgi:hypothetical protein
MGLRTPWSWQSGPSTSSERDHFRELLAGQEFPENTLFCGDAGFTGYDNWFAQPLNNAQLNTVATYYDLVPAFQQLLQHNNGDLEKFYLEVRRLGKLPKMERHWKLFDLQKESRDPDVHGSG